MHLDDRAGKAPPDKGGGPTASIGGGSGFPFPGLFFFDNVPFLDLPDQFPLPVLIPPVGAKMSLSTEPVTKLTHPLSLRDTFIARPSQIVEKRAESMGAAKHE